MNERMDEGEVGSVASGDENGSSDGGKKAPKRRRGRANQKAAASPHQPPSHHHHGAATVPGESSGLASIPPTPQTPQTPPAKRCDDSSTPLRPNQQSQQCYHGSAGAPQHQRPPAAMTVIVRRCDLYDSGLHHDVGSDCGDGRSATPPPPHHHHQTPPPPLDAPRPHVLEYSYQPPPSQLPSTTGHPHSLAGNGSVAVVRVPPPPQPSEQQAPNDAADHHSSFWMQVPVMDKHSQPVPAHFPPHLSKYWYQRRRLFHKFDAGIQLDEESWFSVSPEQVADHVSEQVGRLLEQRSSLSSSHPDPASASSQQHVVLDAFCGCGGNAISFAKCLPGNVAVVAVDLDRTKLRRAAHNARIYGIPPAKICFVECNVLFLLEHVYRDGEFVLDRPCSTPEAALALMQAMPPPVATEVVEGYSVGGIDLLPRTISCAHLDPPWGGVEYQVFGKNGYDLQRNMKIQRPCRSGSSAVAMAVAPGGGAVGAASNATADGTLQNDFFDSFGPPAPSAGGSGGARSRTERRAQFNADLDADSCVDGTELLALAAAATRTRLVTYDVPRNVNRGSLGLAALAAGYRGNCQLEEQHLNGRLKTVTAYFGSDWRHLLAAAAAAPLRPPDEP